jgi:hypothetical protein
MSPHSAAIRAPSNWSSGSVKIELNGDANDAEIVLKNMQEFKELLDRVARLEKLVQQLLKGEKGIEDLAGLV